MTAKNISISAICSAMALACLLVASFLQWFAVVASVVAAVAVCVPMLTVKKNGGLFSFLSYLSSVILGCILGAHNIGYIVIIATYSMPLALFRCYFQNKNLSQKTLPDISKPVYPDPFECSENLNNSNQKGENSATSNKNSTNDPFENAETNADSKKNIAINSETPSPSTTSKVAKWIVYYIICQVSLAVTALSMYLLTPQTLEILLEKNLIWYAVIVANLALPFYIMLLNSCFEILKKPLQRLG